MSRSGGSLKNSTGLMKIKHMDYVMDFNANLRDHQATYIAPAPTLCKCGSEVETQPMEPDVCYDCYRASMTHKNMVIAIMPAKPDAEYSGKQLPMPCPECDGLLIVKVRRMRVRASADRLDYFVGCANFETRGCRHAEPLTAQTKAAIDSMPHDDAPEF